MSRKKRTHPQAKPEPKEGKAAKRSFTVSLSPRWVIGFILAATFLVFANSLRNSFAYDDRTQILENQSIRSFSNIPMLLTKEAWFWTVEQDKDPNKEAGPTTPYYRPLVMIYLMIGWNLFGNSPAGYHFLNILLHLIGVYFAFLIFQRITNDLKLSAIATMLFAIHPLRVESVAWISGATDLLLAVFMLPAFYLYLRYRDTRNKHYLGFSVLLFLLATFVKEPAVMLPVFIFVYELVIINQERRFIERLKPAIFSVSFYIAVSITYFVMRIHALGFMLNDKAFVSHSFSSILLTIPLVICTYLLLLFWPLSLSIYHGIEMVQSPFDLHFFVPLVVLLAIAAGLWQLRHSLIARFAICWFIINLLPVLNLSAFSADFLVQERYVYISSLGFSLLLAMAFTRIPIEKWFTMGSRVTAQLLIITIIGLLLTAKTVAQNSVWKDDITLWTHGAEVADDQAMAHFILGHKYIDRQMMPEAAAELEKFMELRPNNIVVINNLAAAHLLTYEYLYTYDRAHADRAHIDRAIGLCNTGFTLNPSQSQAAAMYDLLGKAYSYETSLKNMDRAIYFFQTGLSKEPDNPIINFHLGTAYFKEQKYDAALGYLKRALEQTADIADLYKILAATYQSKGQVQEAINYYEMYLRKVPNAVDAATISQQVKDLRARSS